MNNNELKLTTGEISSLWTSYMQNTMSICMYKHFLSSLENEKIKDVSEDALRLSKDIVDKITNILKNEKFPIPIGFNDNDVNLSVTPLFTDNFILTYTSRMTLTGLNSYTLALSLSSRDDVHGFFNYCINEGQKLQKKALDLLKEMGLHIRPPYIAVNQSVEYVDKKKYINKYYVSKRPLNYIEISHIHDNIQNLEKKKELLQAFGQVARDIKLAKLLYKVKDTSTEHLKKLRSILEENDLPAPYTWEGSVTDSKENPFSEKLIMQHSLNVLSARITQYGASAALSARKDIAAMYIKFAGSIARLSEDILTLMIEKNLFERPPEDIDRKQLKR